MSVDVIVKHKNEKCKKTAMATNRLQHRLREKEDKWGIKNWLCVCVPFSHMHLQYYMTYGITDPVK